MASGRIARICYRVKDLQVTKDFYCNLLGMKDFTGSESRENLLLVGYDKDGTLLEFSKCSAIERPFSASMEDVYWKIGLAMPDVSTACEVLRSKGLQVTDPSQFQDIGFLCHLKDPNGFPIELLQHQFEKNFTPIEKDFTLPLMQTVHIGQLTLRVSDIKKNLQYYCDALKMKLLSVQKVASYNFDLYFVAWTKETPSGDIHSVDIREWLWMRPYTTLEIQHRYASPHDYQHHDGNEESTKEAYFTGIRVKTEEGSENLAKDPNNIPISCVE